LRSPGPTSHEVGVTADLPARRSGRRPRNTSRRLIAVIGEGTTGVLQPLHAAKVVSLEPADVDVAIDAEIDVVNVLHQSS